MKTMWTLILGLSLTGLAAQAADGEKKPSAPATPAAPGLGGLSGAEILKKYDKNGDGKLDQEERAAMSKDRQAEILKKYDKNGDGKLDESERAAIMADRKKQRDEALARRQAEQKKKEGEAPKK